MRLPWRRPPRRSSCERHSLALFDLVDGGVADARSDAALEHIARCARCREEAAEAALLVVWLGRLGSAERADAGGGTAESTRERSRRRTWDRIRAGIGRPWRPAATGRMAGLLTVPLLVLALAIPRAFGSPACPAPTGDATGASAVVGCGQPVSGAATVPPAGPSATSTSAAGVRDGDVRIVRSGRPDGIDPLAAGRPAVSVPANALPANAQPDESSRPVPRAAVAFPI